MEENKTINKKQRIYLIVGIVLFLILILSASYAYFAITSINNATTTTVTGTGEEIGTPTLSTTTPNLSINLTAEMMGEDANGNRIYATPDGSGINIKANKASTEIKLGNGRYELATVTLDKGVSMDCTITYDITATTTKTMENDSEDIFIIITDNLGKTQEYTLGGILYSDQVYTENVLELKPGETRKLYIESYVINQSWGQNELPGNSYTINITPKSGTNGFKCNVAIEERIKNKDAAQFIASNYSTMNYIWKSGYEGDGYRYMGVGNITDLKNPKNFVCFGTTDKTECTSNSNKYMYRIIGAFQEENGDGTIKQNSPYHLKLIKKTSIGAYPFYSTNDNITWGESDLYKGLNGSYFYTNTNYDYMQNSTWRGKISDWKWTATKTVEGSSYGVNTQAATLKNNYLHELNRSTKTVTTGSWTYPTAKIGLMYFTDYYLSNGSLSSDYRNRWINSLKNDESSGNYYESAKHSDRYITLGEGEGRSYIGVNYGLSLYGSSHTSNYGVRPVFYLDSDVQFSSGSGAYENPFIIKQ